MSSAQHDRIMAQSGEGPEAGFRLLDDVQTFIGRFCAFPDEHCLIAVTLWAAHTHMVQHFHTTPRLALLSPEPASGKTRTLDILDLLVPDSMFALNASAPTVFRKLKQAQVTLLFDEVDAIWRKGKDDNHDDLRGMLNAGYKRGATVPRCEGPKHEVVDFNVFCATALAGIGELPDTIMSRSVIIKMRRRAPHERVEPFRIRRQEPEGRVLRNRLAAWAKEVGEETGNAWPEIPDGICDRPEEIWEPLLAVADAAGGDWPDRARHACVALCKVAENRRESLGIRLLEDLKTIFINSGESKMSTNEILDALKSGDSGLGDDAPWADLYGDGIHARKLANMLKEYGIESTKVRVHGSPLRGYRTEDLWDTWQRYLPPSQADSAEPAEQVEQVEQRERNRATNGDFVDSLPDCDRQVPDVPDVPDFPGGEGEEQGARTQP